MKTVLHLSHTDINYDGRILKEMNALVKMGSIVKGLGVSMSQGAENSAMKDSADITSINLQSRKLTFLPKVIMHCLSVVEVTIKMFGHIIRAKPDLIHCHDTIVLPLGVIAKFFTRSCLIYDAHELESNRNGLSKILGRLTLFVEKGLWSRVDSLIVVSPSILRWYKNTLGEKPTTIILNSPMNDGELGVGHPNGYLREKFAIPENNKIFIYVGILWLGRGIDQIVSVFKENYFDASVVFLGYGNLSNELKKLANEYQNIYVHDAVKHEEVISIVRSADVGLCLIQNVSLSDYYSLPNKLFEYSFSGIPVLASNFPDISEVVQSYKLGFCCDLDFASIKKGILHFVENKNENEFNIKSSTIDRLSWQAQEVKLQELYKTLFLNK